MGVYCCKLSVFSEKLFIPVRFEMLVTKFFQADVYGVESLFALQCAHFYSVLFCTCCLQVCMLFASAYICNVPMFPMFIRVPELLVM